MPALRTEVAYCTETGPTLHCKRCNRHFPNPWAEPAPEKQNQ